MRPPRLPWAALAAAALALAGAVVAIVLLASGGGSSLSPSCVPRTMNASALLGGRVTVSPMPGSRDASAQTQVSLLGVPASELGDVTVTGSRSGRHAGSLAAYSQGDGASFLPREEFDEGEQVHVSARVRAPGHRLRIAWTFTVALRDRPGAGVGSAAVSASSAPEYQRFRSRPDLRPPTITVARSSPGRTPGDVFIAPYAGPGQWGPMILDENGGLVWFKPLPAGWRAGDLRVQRYEGKPVLTWWQDPLPAGGSRKAGVVIADTSYRETKIVRAGNGYQPDLHEFQITPRGTALITVFDAIDCDVSAARGPRTAAAADTLLQEIDLRTGLVRFEWHTLDHVPMQDSYETASLASRQHPFDYFHINSIDVGARGDLLVDSRNTWAAYDVDPHSGRVLWRLGGKHSSFRMAADALPAYQHDARFQADDDVTIFDNGATPAVHPQSRAIELHLDMAHMTASLVRVYTHKPKLVSPSQGNVQVLGDGDWMIGWGQASYITQLGPTGSVRFDAHLPLASESFRAYRQRWRARPESTPAIAYEAATGGSRGRVYASWNGATEVASWRVLAGGTQSALSPVASAAHSGFETSIALPAGAAPRYLQVQALGASGSVLASSPVEREQ
ncbi:MAG TPA: arylsulfotransferase family protein [Solirubrobacteraceae bacterium]|jgi:hypothetical protein|nr:arylsulfotransferase family protein [Solirubrobacteraceae bacterium]